MGTSADPGVQTDESATGAHPETQADVLHRICTQARIDSFQPADLHTGEWHDGTYSDDGAGRFGGPLPVTIIDGPRPVVDTEAASVSVSMTLRVVAPADGAVDALVQTIRGTD
jgi:hypothetical protein